MTNSARLSGEGGSSFRSLRPPFSLVIRAYLWQAIIRLAFCPASTKDQQGWLFQYGRSVKEFWEITSYPDRPRLENGKIKGIINCTDLLNLSLEYEVNSMHKFNVRYSPSSNRKELKPIPWRHDVDGKYFCFPPQPFLSRSDQKVALKKFVPDDVEAVVDGLLLHPRAHQHIKSPIDKHDIRIGGGIDNPYLYLFHLRYQLCPIPAKRRMEKERLMALFSDALKSNSPIAANKLMAQPEI